MSNYCETYDDHEEPYGDETGYYEEDGGAHTDDFATDEPTPEPYNHDVELYDDVYDHPEPTATDQRLILDRT